MLIDIATNLNPVAASNIRINQLLILILAIQALTSWRTPVPPLAALRREARLRQPYSPPLAPHACAGGQAGRFPEATCLSTACLPRFRLSRAIA